MYRQFLGCFLLILLLIGCKALESRSTSLSNPVSPTLPTHEPTPIIKSTDVFDIAFSPDGTKLVIGTFDGTVTVWNVQTGTQELLLGTLTDYVTRVAWSNTDQRGISYIAACAFSGLEPIKIWNAITGQLVFSLEAGRGTCNGLEFAPTTLQLAVAQSHAGETESGIAVYDIETGKQSIVFPRNQLLRSDSTPGGLAWSPDGSILALTDWGSQIFLWNPSELNSIQEISTNPITAASIDWSYDGSLLVTSSEIPGGIGIWNGQSGELIHQLPTVGPIQYDVTFSPTKQRFAYGDYRGRVFVVDALSGNITDRFEVFRSYANAVAWSPDGKRLATSISGWIYIWEIE